jgi:hypothetical protein
MYTWEEYAGNQQNLKTKQKTKQNKKIKEYINNFYFYLIYIFSN